MKRPIFFKSNNKPYFNTLYCLWLSEIAIGVEYQGKSGWNYLSNCLFHGLAHSTWPLDSVCHNLLLNYGNKALDGFSGFNSSPLFHAALLLGQHCTVCCSCTITHNLDFMWNPSHNETLMEESRWKGFSLPQLWRSLRDQFKGSESREGLHLERERIRIRLTSCYSINRHAHCVSWCMWLHIKLFRQWGAVLGQLPV